MATKNSNWSEKPRVGTRDIVPLPGGGFGSSTQANWQNSNIAKDKAWADFKAGRISGKEMEKITGYKNGSTPSAGGWRPPTEGSSTPSNNSTPPWEDGDNPYTPEIERPIDRPSMERPVGIKKIEQPMSAAGLIAGGSSVMPDFSYSDPKKYKKEMLSLDQDIREAQADGDTARADRLLEKKQRANYTVQGLNAGLTEAEAQKYAEREAAIDSKNKAKVPNSGLWKDADMPASVPVQRREDKPRDADRREAIDEAKAQRLANGTPKEQAEYERLKRAGQLPGQDGRPIEDPYGKLKQSKPSYGNDARTTEMRDKNGNGKDDRDEGQQKQVQQPTQGGSSGGRGEGGGSGGGRGGSGGSGGGGRGKGGKGQPQETAKQRNARLEAEADKRRDAQFKANEIQSAIDEGYSRLDPLGSKKFFENAKAKKEQEKQKQAEKQAENPRGSATNKPASNVTNKPASQNTQTYSPHASTDRGGKGWQGYADDWQKEGDRLRKVGDLKGAAEADKARDYYLKQKEGDNPFATVPKLSGKDNQPQTPLGNINANQPELGPLFSPDDSDLYNNTGGNNTGGNNTSGNNVSWNNGGGMSGGQGGGGGNSGSGGSGGRFVTINGEVRYFA